jgi:hypothetical protein
MQGVAMPACTHPLRSCFDIRLALAASLIAIAAFGAADSADASVRGRAPWCGNLSGHGLDDCNYFTFDQCRVSVHGLGGFCSRNPAVANGLPSGKTGKVRRLAR